jgi:hypothetical protein
LRQAYDYWQNQPGNYPEPRADASWEASPGSPFGTRGAGRLLRGLGRHRGATRPSGPPARTRAGAGWPSICPHRVPQGAVRGRSGRVVRPPHRTACAPQEEAIRGRVSAVRRILATEHPRMASSGQWPLANRPQTPQNLPAGPGGLTGLRCPSASQRTAAPWGLTARVCKRRGIPSPRCTC